MHAYSVCLRHDIRPGWVVSRNETGIQWRSRVSSACRYR